MPLLSLSLQVVAVDTSDPHVWVWHFYHAGATPMHYWLEASSHYSSAEVEQAFHRLAPLRLRYLVSRAELSQLISRGRHTPLPAPAGFTSPPLRAQHLPLGPAESWGCPAAPVRNQG